MFATAPHFAVMYSPSLSSISVYRMFATAPHFAVMYSPSLSSISAYRMFATAPHFAVIYSPSLSSISAYRMFATAPHFAVMYSPSLSSISAYKMFTTAPHFAVMYSPSLSSISAYEMFATAPHFAVMYSPSLSSISAYPPTERSVRRSITTLPVVFSLSPFSHLRLHAECSVQHHFSCDVLTASFFHLRLQNVHYVDRSPLFLCCSHYLFLPSPPTERSVRHHFCAVRVYCAVLTISFFHLRLQNIRYVTTSVLCAFTVLFSLSLSSLSAYRTFGTSLLLCCARLLSCSHYLFLPSPPAERSVRRSPLFLCCS